MFHLLSALTGEAGSKPPIFPGRHNIEIIALIIPHGSRYEAAPPPTTEHYPSCTSCHSGSSAKDLGVRFDKDLEFSLHIDHVCNQANRMLGSLAFVSIFSRGIHSQAALRSLYCSLVRPIMRLEALQRRFTRLIGARLGYSYLDVPVDDIARDLHLPSLARRHLLAEIDFRVPSANTRSRELLGRRHHFTNFDYNSPLAIFARLGNRVACECDIFWDSIHCIHRLALTVFSS
ncbi:hypothetical protein J6590_061665 [Homalodisca vitripennis]|nr:hypothetical protein J6590_061665 [Homalodisca vitripennis]